MLQTNRQTNKQTDRQTDGGEHSTHADRLYRRGNVPTSLLVGARVCGSTTRIVGRYKMGFRYSTGTQLTNYSIRAAPQCGELQ